MSLSNSRMLRMYAAQSLESPAGVVEYVRRGPYRYREFSIPKRRGGRRMVAQPTARMKRIQRWVVREVLGRSRECKVHPAAIAYRKGMSILDGAEPHAENRWLLKLDLRQFFESISDQDLLGPGGALEESSGADREFVRRVCFRRRSKGRRYFLTVGAPSSPSISNIVMYPIDASIGALCEERSVAYTRYADDLTFSARARQPLEGIEVLVGELLRAVESPRLQLNVEKRFLGSTKGRRRVLGLVLANDGRVGIGRDRRRELRARCHSVLSGRAVNAEALAELAGMLEYCRHVDAQFVSALERKYGPQFWRNW